MSDTPPTAPAGDGADDANAGWLTWAAAGTFGGAVVMFLAFSAGLLGGAVLDLPGALPAAAQISVRTPAPERTKPGAERPARLASNEPEDAGVADVPEPDAGAATETAAEDGASSGDEGSPRASSEAIPVSAQSDTYDPGADPWAEPQEAASAGAESPPEGNPAAEQ